MTSSQVGGKIQTSLRPVRVSTEMGVLGEMGVVMVGVVLAVAWIPDTQVVVEVMRVRVERS
jgi:hypothetical protein